MDQIPVLDQGYVKLIDTLPSAIGYAMDMAVVDAARVSFDDEHGDFERDTRLINYLMAHQHSSPFEQAVFKLEINAPILVWWHWLRHRTHRFAHVNSVSGRYTQYQENALYTPQEWRKQAQSNKQASEGVLDPQVGQQLTETLLAHYDTSYKLYEQALEAGVARELARLFLPAWGQYYRWVVSVDAWNLLHFITLRNAPGAQYEIREYARVLATIVAYCMPLTFAAYQENRGA